MPRKRGLILYTALLKRLYCKLKEIKGIAEELETNDMVLVAHLLILDSINYQNRSAIKGVKLSGDRRFKKKKKN